MESEESEILITVLKNFAVKGNRNGVVARGICEVKNFLREV